MAMVDQQAGALMKIAGGLRAQLGGRLSSGHPQVCSEKDSLIACAMQRRRKWMAMLQLVSRYPMLSPDPADVYPHAQAQTGLAAKTALEVTSHPLQRTQPSFPRPHLPAPLSLRHRHHPRAQKDRQTGGVALLWIMSGKPSWRSWTALPRTLKR